MTFADKVEALGRIYDASVTSWGRTTKRNAAVGGAKNSRHLDWKGADLVPDREKDYIPMEGAARALGLYTLKEKDHLHVGEPRR